MKMFAQLFRLLTQQLVSRLFSTPAEPVLAPVRTRSSQPSGRIYEGESRRLTEPNRW